ncbi:exodeoxyribonuclease V subunit beta [Sansalvadorimonas sp. 2012CJ34-2]|uniref:RecBCD enzyme subunit RecB n=1 Tax=Parendozoicomonas callyspongiae TaxID=2942213 RepID=A0ABT0PM78_9GAMM|nr:exodeoxyribonuclease V subunit beta [Sansalvadorimonas sp. 2012CJ34-2]MCL6271837.1 exodeoxyribonuclease V subunit beta [Sansalvadorimonas sp. 2012CJ34-2]
MSNSMNETVDRDAQNLDPLTLLLHGHRLIEASAGTGKTWTIAALYLRLLLGHGREQNSAHCQPLTVDQILVVTFTEAATEELRDRIRGRIHQARQAFLSDTSDDPFLKELLQDLGDHPLQAKRLLAAERQMDEAAIFTIHGFCQRMLKQHAFESGTLFTSDLLEDQSELVADAVADFWRRTMYPLNEELTDLTRQIWKAPENLQASLQYWLNQHGLKIDETGIPDSMADLDKRIQDIRQIKALWLEQRDLIEAELAKILRKNSKPWKRLAEMADFAASSSLIPQFGKENGWEFYTLEALAKACTKGKTVPDLEIFTRIEQLQDQALDIKEAFRGLILRDALKEVQSRLIQRRNELRKMIFDDLLIKLDQALQSSGGEALADHIRDIYRVALIDEFQDTDAVQYRIFSNIYPQSHTDNGLFLIGDPKQAIYAFRGADIFTYIQARKAITSRYTLPRNWRSSADMISATNHLFDQAQSAFIYDQDIPFLPVDSSPDASSRGLLIDDQSMPALKLWYQDNGGFAIGRGDYEQTMADATASEINRLLSLAKDQRCLTGSKDGQKPLTPGDIAILVRTGAQAEKVRLALNEQNIASVYLSDRSSVFDSYEALDLSRILAACLEPTSERKLKAALATPLFALQASALDELNNDEQCWENAVEEFTGYHDKWMHDDVLPMLRHLISKRQLAENLLADANGERRLTDLLHLGELLAAAAREKDTPHALLRWLQERIASPDQNAKDQQLHLESEQKLVKIVTIHKSKGLEYGVVFIPFVCTWRAAEQGVYHDEDNNYQVVANLLAQPEALEQADKERMAEDLRLLYVALTRSVHACYMGIAPVKRRPRKQDIETHLNQTAFGYLLASGNMIDTKALEESLHKLGDGCSAISISKVPEPMAEPYSSPEQSTPELSAREFTGRIDNNWWMTSYSALSRKASHQKADVNLDASHELAGVDQEVQGQDVEPVTIEREPYTSLLDFPRGARPGTFLHEIFENVTFENPQQDVIAEMIRERLLVNGIEDEWLPVLQTMVNDTLSAPLNEQGLKLTDLQSGDYKPELEFNLSLGLLQCHKLNTLLRESSDPLSPKAGNLDFYNVRGLLKGFIDLTFQHNGKWFVLDWKSNWLGETTSAYTHKAMADAMIDHRYDLQYLIYTLALHRLLKTRLPDYDYDTHIGGIFYIFLRGIQPDNPERTGVYAHKPERELIEAMDRLFAGEHTDSKEANVC